MYPVLILGILFRPTATFAWAKQNVRFGYWWILISDFTICAVSAAYSPRLPGAAQVAGSIIATSVVLDLVTLYVMQALLLVWAGRRFRWTLSWGDSLKFVGLAWSVLLAQDVATYFPYLKGDYPLVLWGSVPFLVWYLLATAAGVRQWSGLPLWKSFALAALASLPWQVPFFWMNWAAVHSA